MAISSSDTTLAYRFGRNICTNCSSVSRMDSRTVDPNLVVIRLARTMGYGLFSINELILTEAQEAPEVASSNFFARCTFFFAYKREEKTATCSKCSFGRKKFMMYVSKKIITTSSIYVTWREKGLSV